MQGERENDDLVMMLVESALEREPGERESFLQPLCSATPGLYEEVWNRIEWEERMGAFLRDPLIPRPDGLAQPFAAGELVSGRFRIVRVVGRGGMGVVYEALDEKLDRRIAIKCAQIGFQSRLPPEARSAREVSHYNVCKVHELHTAHTPSGEVDFIVMEFVDGETLSQRITRSGALSLVEAREIALQLCAGLAQAHRQGVVHGDLKCANVILAKSSESGVRAVLTDFGLAKLKLGDGGGFGRSERGGTLDYMAPELFMGEPTTFASDIYALGVMFHMMLTGHAPARLRTPAMAKASGGTGEVTVTLGSVRESEWTREVADLPSPWRAVVNRCLAADRKARFGSIFEIVQAINPKRQTAKWVWAAMMTVVPLAGYTAWHWQSDNGIPVRLAVLPAAIEGAPIPGASGIIDDVAARLSEVRGRFLVISSGEAQRNKVDTPQKAKAVLGATHVLKTSLRNSGQEITALASIIDVGSGLTIRELRGSYAPANISVLAKALTATVSSAFQLRGAESVESVNPAAYPDYTQGLALLRRGFRQSDAALESFGKAATLDPKSALPQARLAEVAMQKFQANLGREWLTRAEESIARAQSINPDSYLTVYIAGSIKKLNGRYEEAVQNYQRAIALDPKSWDAWRNLAGVYGAMNQPAQAIASYQKAIEVNPEHYAPYLNFGEFYFSMGQYSQAEELFRKVTAMVPSNLNGQLELGLTLNREGRFPEAEAALRRAIAIDETPIVLVNLGALYFSQSRFAEAAELFERSLQAGPPTATEYCNLGDAYERLGRKRESMEAYQKALGLAEADVTLNPRQAYLRAILASIAAGLGDANRAQFELAQALQMDPQNIRVLRQAVETYELLKDRDKALAVVRQSPKSLVADLGRNPLLGSLQKDPQFQALLKQ